MNKEKASIKTLRPFPLAAYVDPRVGENPDFSVVESPDPDEDGGDFLMELVLRKPVDLGLNGVWRAAVALGGSEGEPEIGLPAPLAGYSEEIFLFLRAASLLRDFLNIAFLAMEAMFVIIAIW